MTLLRLSSVQTFFEPFPHLLSLESLELEVSYRVLAWFELGAPWRLVETNFYEQFEFSLLDAQLPPELAFLQSPSFLTTVRLRVADLFGIALSERVDVTAHRLVPGQRIRLHNDFIDRAETHRLLIQLNRDWKDENGGFLLFFKSSDTPKIFRPVHNSAIAFAITPESYHAVSALYAGERFTLVYSFYG